jgi:hypothetical protein
MARSTHSLRPTADPASQALAQAPGLGPKSAALLWAMGGALSGLHWQHVAREHRTSLLLALEQLQTDGTR